MTNTVTRQPLPTVVRWADWNGEGLEHCYVREGDDGLVIEGVVAGNRQGKFGSYYNVRTDSIFRTREVQVMYLGGPAIHLEADMTGNWHDLILDQSLPHLAGCIDVDIGMTPATNTLPIRRLGLGVGEAADITAAYIPLPAQVTRQFAPQKVAQRYTCLEPSRRYLYEGIFRNFSAELVFDETGLVLDYPNTFRRVFTNSSGG